MNRIGVIVLACALSLAAAVTFSRARWLAPAMTQGRAIFEHRNRIRSILDTPPPFDVPSILFMGDSTALGEADYPSWVHGIGTALLQERVYPIYDIYRGQDTFHHYCVSGALLAWKPEVVVIIINNRMMVAKRREGVATNLCSFLPSDQLIRSLGLPWHDRGLSLVRLGLTQALRFEAIEGSVMYFEGLRRLFADHWMAPSDAALVRARARAFQRTATRYDQPVTHSHPLVRALGALVSEVHRAGGRALVVVTPVPIHWMERDVPYEPAVWRRRHDALNDVVTSAGGELLDLHNLLGPSEFRDIAGHLNASGHARMTNAVAPTVYRMLGLPEPNPMPVPDPPAEKARGGRRPPLRR